MMPALHRGDVIFSTNTGVEIEVKDIIQAEVNYGSFDNYMNKKRGEGVSRKSMLVT